jgi:hypothetical protein
MSDAEPSLVRPAEALRRLHESLPAWVNFTIGRSDNAPGLDWTVVIQVPDPDTGADRYSRSSRGTDLGVAVEEALDEFRRWAGVARPPKLTAPGATRRRHGKQRRKDAS